MNLQESIRRILREEETPKYDDGGSSVYEKEKPYQVYSPITQNVEGYFENKKEAEQFTEKFEDSIVYDIREEEKVGKEFWFEYHCFESDESCDAEIWYRSHQKVKVVDVAHWSLDDKEFRYEDGQFRVYIVEWEDGFQYDVFEDELMESPNEFYRPSPPKRKIQESIRRILREELSPRVKRRIGSDEMEKEFLESFESAYNLTKDRKVLRAHFLDELIYTTISIMMDGYHWRFVSTLPEDEFWYDDIHTGLQNHYRDRITQMYNERQEK